ncbi:MAG: peroxiredoxin [Desulfatirhabdiaceae bacterium]
MRKMTRLLIIATICILINYPLAGAVSDVYKENIFDTGQLKATDSTLKVKVGDPAPAFSLKSISGQTVSLSQFIGKNHVVISFVPAAWTPVCSDQWPGYNLVKGVFEENQAILLGISVDNIPTLYAWTRQMGDLWFSILSDFWPHGAVADSFGVLRSDGMAERAIIMIDKAGIIQYIHVSDINQRPELEELIDAVSKLK